MSDTEREMVNSDVNWAPIVNHNLESDENWHLGE